MGFIPGAYVPSTSEAKFKAWMGSMEGRMTTLETQQRLFNASVKGGAVVVLTDGAAETIRLGRGQYTTASGVRVADLVTVNDPSGNTIFLADTERGLLVPGLPITFTKEEGYFLTPAMGTNVSIWCATLVVSTQVLYCTFVPVLAAGANADFWLELNEFGPITTKVHLTSTNQIIFRWDISTLIGFGNHCVLRLRGEITNGTGSVTIPNPNSCFMSNIGIHPTADVNGDN